MSFNLKLLQLAPPPSPNCSVFPRLLCVPPVCSQRRAAFLPSHVSPLPVTTSHFISFTASSVFSSPLTSCPLHIWILNLKPKTKWRFLDPLEPPPFPSFSSASLPYLPEQQRILPHAASVHAPLQLFPPGFSSHHLDFLGVQWCPLHTESSLASFLKLSALMLLAYLCGLKLLSCDTEGTGHTGFSSLLNFSFADSSSSSRPPKRHSPNQSSSLIHSQWIPIGKSIPVPMGS